VLLGGLLLSLLVMVMVLTVLLLGLLLGVWLLMLVGLTFPLLVLLMLVCSVLPVMFLCAFDDLRFNYYGFTLAAWVCYCYVSF
jgi:hypothetical protein